MTTMTRHYKTVTCSSCEVLVINNHICHENGCPEAWRDEVRECVNCGCDFKPEDHYQKFCDYNCAESYNS